MQYSAAETRLIERHARQLAERCPGNKYDTPDEHCSYRKGLCTNGTTGCIVGQAILAAGLELPEYDFRVGMLAKSPWLESVQNMQDSGKSWGYAVDMASKPTTNGE